jgi:membrane protease YdiL (CAAX protease family)
MSEIIPETEPSSLEIKQPKAYPSIKQGWGIIGILLLVSTIYSIPLGILQVMKIDIQQGPFLLLNYAIPFLILLLIIYRKWKNNSLNNEVFRIRSFSPVLVPGVVLMVLALVYVDSEIGSWIPMPDFLEELFEQMLAPSIWGFLTVVVAAPILEELLMRGIVLNGLLRNYSPWKAIVWSSVFFGVMHLNPWQFITAMIMGMAIGYLYWKTKSLLLCMFIHALNNGIAYYMMFRYSDFSSLSELFNLGIGERIALFIASGFVIYGLYRYFESYFKNSSLQE